MKKESYDFEAKRAYRTRLREFILKHYPDPLVRQNLRVACLPGHEGLEVTEVYLPLGIKPTSIYGIEEKVKRAQELEALGLGINVYPGSAQKFFLENSKKFDIVNLDFQSQFGDKEINAFLSVFHNERVKDRFIFGSNFYGSRESEIRKSEYCRTVHYFSEGGNTRRLGLLTQSTSYISAVQALSPKSAQFKTDSLEETRDFNISLRLRYGLSSNTPKETLDDLLEDPLLNVYLSSIDGRFSLERVIENPLQHFKDVLFLASIRDLYATRVFHDAFPTNQQMQVTLHTLWENLHLHRPYFIRDFIKGRYVSDKGAPMFFDFVYCENYKDFTKGLRYCLEQAEETCRLRIKLGEKEDIQEGPQNMRPLCENELADWSRCKGNPMVLYKEGGLFLVGTGKRFWKKVGSLMQAHNNELEYVTSPREEIVTKSLKEKIRDDLMNKIPRYEILAKYSLSSAQLAGHKAALRRVGHLQSSPTLRFYEQKASLSRDQREDIISLLEQGHPEQEIVDYYFLTQMQFAAHKAILTRRRNRVASNLSHSEGVSLALPIVEESSLPENNVVFSSKLKLALDLTAVSNPLAPEIQKRVDYFVEDILYSPSYDLASEQRDALAASLDEFDFARKLRNRKHRDPRIVYTFFDDVMCGIYRSKQAGRVHIPSKNELESLFESVVEEMTGGTNEERFL